MPPEINDEGQGNRRWILGRNEAFSCPQRRFVTAQNAPMPIPKMGYQSSLPRPNHKLVLQKDRYPYKYPETINIFLPI
jgi:hypothetical protein